MLYKVELILNLYTHTKKKKEFTTNKNKKRTIRENNLHTLMQITYTHFIYF